MGDGAARAIEKITEAKQWSDLHTDQLSQAVLLRFAESGGWSSIGSGCWSRVASGCSAALEACEKYLPAGPNTRGRAAG